MYLFRHLVHFELVYICWTFLRFMVLFYLWYFSAIFVFLIKVLFYPFLGTICQKIEFLKKYQKELRFLLTPRNSNYELVWEDEIGICFKGENFKNVPNTCPVTFRMNNKKSCLIELIQGALVSKFQLSRFRRLACVLMNQSFSNSCYF